MHVWSDIARAFVKSVEDVGFIVVVDAIRAASRRSKRKQPQIKWEGCGERGKRRIAHSASFGYLYQDSNDITSHCGCDVIEFTFHSGSLVTEPGRTALESS